MPGYKLKEFLDSRHIRYTSIKHSPSYTAQEIAQSAHISGKEMLKTVMVQIDGEMAMAVLPASYRVDLDVLKASTGAKNVELTPERQFKDKFPDCEVGAMPPFGNLYGVTVFASPRIAEDELIAFNAGTHTELIQLGYRDYAELVSPNIVRLSQHD
ncbi:MAG: aminoacyl-tRNA deacylase [Gammaproteobacteria bacterium]